MTSIVRCPTYSTSSAVVKRWRLKRIDEWASSAEAPSAAITYEGSSVDEVHAEPDDQRHRQGPRAHAALVAAAIDHRRDPDARPLAPHVQRADALGTVDQMRRARQKVDAHGLDVDRDLADGLGGVGVEEDALSLGQLADGRDILDGADLVVGEHHGDQDGLVRERLADLLDVDETVGLHRHVGHLKPLPLEALERVDARALLDDGGDDVVAFLLVHLGRALEGEVDRLGAARGEHELLRIARTDQ